MSKASIIITGFMGTGKSTVAPMVANALGWRWIETDAVIVQQAGMTIPEIFAVHGEPYFRQMERDLCQSLAQETECVISTGGGMLVDEENRRIMQESGFVVCLVTAPEVISRRLDSLSQSRPLAVNWRDLLAHRQAAYAQIPHQVDTTGKSPYRIAEEIVTLWRSESA